MTDLSRDLDSTAVTVKTTSDHQPGSIVPFPAAQAIPPGERATWAVNRLLYRIPAGMKVLWRIGTRVVALLSPGPDFQAVEDLVVQACSPLHVPCTIIPAGRAEVILPSRTLAPSLATQVEILAANVSAEHPLLGLIGGDYFIVARHAPKGADRIYAGITARSVSTTQAAEVAVPLVRRLAVPHLLFLINNRWFKVRPTDTIEGIVANPRAPDFVPMVVLPRLAERLANLFDILHEWLAAVERGHRGNHTLPPGLAIDSKKLTIDWNQVVAFEAADYRSDGQGYFVQPEQRWIVGEKAQAFEVLAKHIRLIGTGRITGMLPSAFSTDESGNLLIDTERIFKRDR